jgi:hypothetical protein
LANDVAFRLATSLYTSPSDSQSELAECDNEEHGFNLNLHQEILMSYRLIFGQTRSSRSLARSTLQSLKSEPDYDALLDIVCGESRKTVAARLPSSLWPVSCRSFDGDLQEEDTYSSQDDFPMFGPRLAALQLFNLRQQPSRLRDLWRDRRNPLQWYTFWAVVIIGGLANVLALLQLVVAIVAVPLTSSPECACSK